MFNKFLSLFLASFLLLSDNTVKAQEAGSVNPKSDFTKIKSMLGDSKIVTITYPHPRDQFRFGEVFFKLNFDDATAEMGNRLGTYKGYFFAFENVICAASTEFNSNCFVFSKEGDVVSVKFYSNPSFDAKFKIK